MSRVGVVECVRCRAALDDQRLKQVRDWALAHQPKHMVSPVKVRASVRRRQRQRIGELWQLDASPHSWFPHAKHSFPALNTLDHCSRLFAGSKIHERELRLCQLQNGLLSKLSDTGLNFVSFLAVMFLLCSLVVLF